MPEALYAPLPEPVAYALRFPSDTLICLSTVFDTRAEAQDYLETCSEGTEIVPLYADATCSLRSAPTTGDLHQAFAERYKRDPADPSCAEMLRLYSDGWADCSLRGGQIPDGWKLVPIDPTQKMVKAGDQKSWVLPSSDCWAAMLDAAPPPPSTHPQEKP